MKNTALILFLLCLTACTNIDCPHENVVMVRSGIFSSEDGNPLTIKDTLTVKVARTDSILWNRGIGISELRFPLSITAEKDTLLFRFSNEKGQAACDTLFIEHTNTPHFESVDCPAAMFHRIKSVRWTSHHLSEMPLTIDSISVTRPNVNYETSHNIQLYLRSTSR